MALTCNNSSLTPLVVALILAALAPSLAPRNLVGLGAQALAPGPLDE
jgi:hypothetical protein